MEATIHIRTPCPDGRKHALLFGSGPLHVTRALLRFKLHVSRFKHMPEDQKPGFQVQADPKDLKGRYANAFSITSQERDVAIDFFSHVNTAGQPAQLVSRVFLNHIMARDLITTLQNTLAQWEKMRYEGGQKPL